MKNVIHFLCNCLSNIQLKMECKTSYKWNKQISGYSFTFRAIVNYHIFFPKGLLNVLGYQSMKHLPQMVKVYGNSQVCVEICMKLQHFENVVIDPIEFNGPRGRVISRMINEGHGRAQEVSKRRENCLIFQGNHLLWFSHKSE